MWVIIIVLNHKQKKISKKILDDCIILYKTTPMTFRQIAKHHNIDPNKLYYILRIQNKLISDEDVKNHTKIKKSKYHRKWQFPPKKIMEKAIEMCKQNYSTSEICNVTGISAATINNKKRMLRNQGEIYGQ